MYCFKSASSGNIPVIITLFITENSKSNVNRSYMYKQVYAKHRCNKAYVTKIEDDYGNEFDTAETFNLKTNNLIRYTKNQYIIADSYDENKENVTGSGLYFFLDKDLARNYKRKIGDQIWNNISNLYQTFYNNGCIKERIFFVHLFNNKIIEHTIERWLENGIKKFEKNYNEGEYYITEWHDNGIIMKQYILINDKIDGIYSEWYVNGKFKTIKEYNHGILNGNCSEWYINGNKRLETEYDNGIIVQKYKKLYKDNEEILTLPNLKINSITTHSKFNNYKEIVPLIIPIQNNPIRSKSTNLYDKYNNDSIIDEIKNKKELIKTNSVHYSVRKNISNRKLLTNSLHDNKYMEIN
jgi:antitoxin component YwqK of YwqJK toxin-antitoxin module